MSGALKEIRSGLIIFYMFLNPVLGVEFSGFTKNHFSHEKFNQENYFPISKTYQNHFISRLKIKHEIKGLIFESHYEFNAVTREALKYQDSIGLINSKFEETDNYFNLTKRIYQKNDWDVYHYLDRLSLAYSMNDFDFLIGRSPINWGVGKIWSPLNRLSNLTPIAFDNEVRPGVDIIQLNFKLSDSSQGEYVFRPIQGRKNNLFENDQHAIRLKSNFFETDIAFISYFYPRLWITGVELARGVYDGLLRFEGAWLMPDKMNNYFQIVLGYDYSFEFNLNTSFEYLFNSNGMVNNYDLERIDPILKSISKHYLGIILSYELVSDFKVDYKMIMNILDKSLFINPCLEYTLNSNLSLVLGALIFAGTQDEEFGGRFKLGPDASLPMGVGYSTIQYFSAKYYY